MNKLPKARDYQEKGLTLMRKAFQEGNRKIMFWLATGGGKSVIFILLVAGLLSNKKKVLLVVKRRQLVFQTQRHFSKWGILSSIMIGATKGFNKALPLQICSIDTIARRDISFLGDFDFTIVDECHDTTSDNYKELFKQLQEMNPNMAFIGLTATPFPIGKKIHDFWQCCVKPIEVHELRDRGYLTPCDVFIPSEIDLSSIGTKAGDYDQKDLAEKMSDMEIIGDVVETYQKLGNNKPAILFAVNKEHSILMAEAFTQAGIPAIHCDESTPQKERDEAIKGLQTGKYKILSNVNIFSTGVDIPEAEVGIMARPTKSEVLYIQQVGRLLRPYRRCGKCKTAYDNSEKCPVCGYDKPEYIKEKAVILDHGNNISRHGSPFRIRKAVLTKEDVKEKEKDDSEMIAVKTCKNCFIAYPAHLKICPSCQIENEKQQRVIKRKDGKLVPYNEFLEIQESLKDFELTQRLKGLKPNFKFFKLYEKYGDTVYLYPELKVPKWIPKIVEKNSSEGKVYR
jgi:superfamily II DNA or RNA helicase